MTYPDSPFYLAINYASKDFSRHSWYKAAPLGKNSLGVLLRKITSDANLKGKFSNHSVRKTGITNLLHAGVAPNLVQQMSGHKSLDSLKNYATASANQQKMMADILANPEKAIAPVEKAIAPIEKNQVCLEKMQMPISGDIPIECTKDIQQSNKASMMTGLFSGASLSGCTFNMSFVMKQD